METFLHDIRFTLRTLRNSPGFAFVAILSLALGIGANSAIYSVYTAIFARDLGVTDPAGLVNVYTSDWEFDEHAPVSYPDFLDYREQTRDLFEDMTTYNMTIAVRDLGEETEYAFGEEVTGNYFDLLGVQPLLGRLLDERDDRSGADPVMVLSYQEWQAGYGADPGVVGDTMKLNGLTFTIVGVAPERFTGMFPFEVDYWIPLHARELIAADFGFASSGASLQQRGSRNLWVKARLREGATIEQASASLATVSARLAESYPDTNEDRHASVLLAREVAMVPFIDRPVRLFLIFLMAMVGLVLLIACTNLASMLLARASRRRREIGIRLAVGASRWRLIRQLLTESNLLALAGAAVGLLVAEGLIRLLLATQPPIPITVNVDLGVDAGVIGFAVFLALATGTFFGLAPALQTTSRDMMTALRGAHDALTGRLRRLGLRSSLVVAQVAVSAVLLLCAGLFVRSLGNASQVDRGFTLRQGAIATLDIGYSGRGRAYGEQFYADLRERLLRSPGVRAVGYGSDLPLDASISATSFWPLDTDVPFDEETGVEADISDVDGAYFGAMGVDIVLGRAFGPEDLPEGDPVCIINQTFANRYWPDESPVGKRIRSGRTEPVILTVVGVARDGKYRSLGERPRSFLYRPLSQRYTGFRAVVVGSTLPDGETARLLRSEIRALDPDVPFFDLITVPQHAELMLFLPRMVAALVGGLGLLALLLGTTGLYGVIAYDASRRTREVGIRMALGADRRRVLTMVLWDGMKLVVVGMAIGLLLAGAVTGLLTSLLYGISPLDPVTFVGVTVLFILITTAATLSPARRASRTDPMTALRTE